MKCNMEYLDIVFISIDIFTAAQSWQQTVCRQDSSEDSVLATVANI